MSFIPWIRVLLHILLHSMQVKKRGLIKEAVSALQQKVDLKMKKRVRPTSLTFVREKKGEELAAMELRQPVHHRLQTDFAECRVNVDDYKDAAGNMKVGGAWKQGAVVNSGEVSCDPGDGDATFCCPCVKRIFGPKKTGDHEVAHPKDLTVTMDTSHTSYYPVDLEFCEVEEIRTFQIPKAKRRPSPLRIPDEINANFSPIGSSCLEAAAIDIPGYIPATTVHTSDGNTS